MLTVFPNLLDYALFAPFILRLGVGILFLIRGITLVKQKETNASWNAFWARRIRQEKLKNILTIHGALECVIGIAFVFGFLTQIAAILAIVFTLVEWQNDNESGGTVDINKKFSFILVILISISLLFLGAGLIAIDLPL